MAPIHLAAWFGSLEIVQLLVQAGAEQKVENEVTEHCFTVDIGPFVFLICATLLKNMLLLRHVLIHFHYPGF